MAKWIKGTKTLDLNVKVNMDGWRQRLDVSQTADWTQVAHRGFLMFSLSTRRKRRRLNRGLTSSRSCLTRKIRISIYIWMKWLGRRTNRRSKSARSQSWVTTKRSRCITKSWVEVPSTSIGQWKSQRSSTRTAAAPNAASTSQVKPMDGENQLTTLGLVTNVSPSALALSWTLATCEALSPSPLKFISNAYYEIIQTSLPVSRFDFTTQIKLD